MKIVFDEEVKDVGRGIWFASVAPHDLRQLGSIPPSKGERSVLLIGEPIFDPSRCRIEFDRPDLTILNLGTSPDTVIIKSAGAPDKENKGADTAQPPSGATISPGDEAFLRTVRETMPGAMVAAAEELLTGVRKHYPGGLKQGQRRRFTESPDNFWMILVQPRAKNFYISVRGAPERHQSQNIRIRSGRNPNYAAFYLEHASDVKEALEIVLKARNF